MGLNKDELMKWIDEEEYNKAMNDYISEYKDIPADTIYTKEPASSPIGFRLNVGQVAKPSLDKLPTLPKENKSLAATGLKIDDARKLMQKNISEYKDIPADTIYTNPEQKKASITDMLRAARDEKKEAIEKQRSSDLQIARMHALSDVMSNLFAPVAWKIGGGGSTSFTSPVKQDNSGYIEAFNRARQASDKLVNLDAAYQDAMIDYSIDKARREQDYAMRQAMEAQARVWREKEAAKAHERDLELLEKRQKYQSESDQAERESREKQAAKAHEYNIKEIDRRYNAANSEKNKPTKLYLSKGEFLSFDNADKEAEFIDSVRSYMTNEDLNKGIDDTMDKATIQAIRTENIKNFIKKDPQGFYDAWMNGKSWSPAPKQVSYDNPFFSPKPTTERAKPSGFSSYGGIAI